MGWRGGGWLLSQNFQSAESDLQRNCTRVADNFWVFRGKHFMTSPLNIVTTYDIGSLFPSFSRYLPPPSLSLSRSSQVALSALL